MPSSRPSECPVLAVGRAGGWKLYDNSGGTLVPLAGGGRGTVDAHDRRSPGELGGLGLAGADAALRQVDQCVRREAAVTGRTVVVFRDREIAWGKPDGLGVSSARAKHWRRRDMKADEVDLGSHVADMPDGNAAGLRTNHRSGTEADCSGAPGSHRERRRPPGLRDRGSQIIIRRFPDRIEFRNPGDARQHADRGEPVRGLPARSPQPAPRRFHAGTTRAPWPVAASWRRGARDS